MLPEKTFPSPLLALPDELVLHILKFLDVPDLIALSRTCSQLRVLPSDHVLHRQRLESASHHLSWSLTRRPPLSSLRPPSATIYLTSTLLAARKISRKIVGIRLKKKLKHRPDVGDLVGRGVLPGECFVLVPSSAGNGSAYQSYRQSTYTSRPSPRRSIAEHQTRETSTRSTADHRAAGYVAPGIVGIKRGLERERIKDRIRDWVQGRGKQELERRRTEREKEAEKSVGTLVRRFAFKGSMEERDFCMDSRVADRRERWGKGAAKWGERKKKEPTRAHVHGLKHFWEGIGRI